MITYRISILIGNANYCHEFVSLADTVENLTVLSKTFTFNSALIKNLPMLIAAAEHIQIMLDNDEAPENVETVRFTEFVYIDVFYERCED